MTFPQNQCFITAN